MRKDKWTITRKQINTILRHCNSILKLAKDKGDQLSILDITKSYNCIIREGLKDENPIYQGIFQGFAHGVFFYGNDQQKGIDAALSFVVRFKEGIMKSLGEQRRVQHA